MRVTRRARAGVLALVVVRGASVIALVAVWGTHAIALVAAWGANAGAQAAPGAPRPVTREEAVARAVARGPRLAIARADSVFARAQLSLARQFENPVLGLSYSKEPPEHHTLFDLALDVPWLRSPRVGAAEAALGAAASRFAFERAAVAFGADTMYTNALAAEQRARLSRRTALEADSLAALARLRRDAGDGSELDVQVAALTAGQLANAAAADALEATTTLLAVQAVMGLPAEAPGIVLADSLPAAPGAGDTVPARAFGAANGTPLLIAAAEDAARAAELALVLERRRAFGAPALASGFEWHDPGAQEKGLLPVLGVGFAVPLFNLNRAAVTAAQAQRDRALAELAFVRIEAAAALARARRTLVVAVDRAMRSARLLDAANRVASLSLLAYREGAAALPNVLEVQRAAREAQAQHVNDVAAARNAAGLVRLLEAAAAPRSP